MEKKFKLIMAAMPNYIFIEIPSSQRQDGINHAKISVHELNESECMEYAEAMKNAFIENWKSKTIK